MGPSASNSGSPAPFACTSMRVPISSVSVCASYPPSPRAGGGSSRPCAGPCLEASHTHLRPACSTPEPESPVSLLPRGPHRALDSLASRFPPPSPLPPYYWELFPRIHVPVHHLPQCLAAAAATLPSPAEAGHPCHTWIKGQKACNLPAIQLLYHPSASTPSTCRVTHGA